MKKAVAEPYRDFDFSEAKRGPVIPPEPGKTKISIRIDNSVIEHFRAQVERAGSGNYQNGRRDQWAQLSLITNTRGRLILMISCWS